MKRYLGLIPAAIIFPIMILTLSGNISDMFQYVIVFRWWYLILSISLVVGYFIIIGFGWWLVLFFLKERLSIPDAIRISVLALMGKYIPGKIWTIAGKIYLANHRGVSKKTAYTSTIYEFILINLSGLIVFFAINVIQPGGVNFSYFIPIIFSIGICFFVIFPGMVSCFINSSLRVARQAPMSNSLARSQLVFCFVYYSIGWCIAGLSFYWFVLGLIPGVSYAELTAALIIASIIGFAILIVPAGLGVREGIIASYLILSNVSSDTAVFISLTSRVWSTVGELLIIVPMFFLGNSGSFAKKD